MCIYIYKERERERETFPGGSMAKNPPVVQEPQETWF